MEGATPFVAIGGGRRFQERNTVGRSCQAPDGRTAGFEGDARGAWLYLGSATAARAPSKNPLAVWLWDDVLLRRVVVAATVAAVGRRIVLEPLNCLDFQPYCYNDGALNERRVAMKRRLFLLPCAVVTLFALSTIPSSWGVVATFDELAETGSGSFFSVQYQGYQGLTWNYILCRNAILGGPTAGIVSPSNIVFLGLGGFAGNPSEIVSPGTNFNFRSAYLMASFSDSLNIEVQGFRSGNLLYDQTVTTSATDPTLFTLNYLNIDRLRFQCADFRNFVMDDFTFEFVPEPSTVLLAVGGGLMLLPFLKRKRV